MIMDRISTFIVLLMAVTLLFGCKPEKAAPARVRAKRKGESDRNNFYLLDKQFSGYEVVDRIDLEDPSSEERNQFKEIFLPGKGKVYHEKSLAYKSPMEKIVLVDNGRRIHNIAMWQVHDVSPRKDLVMIARYDKTGKADYTIEVNGKKVKGVLPCRGGPECWDEAWIIIPASMLKEGTNDFRMIRIEEFPSDAELYYFWFLQK